MYICLCKGITDTQIKQCVDNGATSLQQVRRELGVATQCCKCLPEARAIIDQQLQAQTNEQQPAYNLFSNGAMFYPA